MSAPRVRLGDLSVGFVQALADALLAAGVEPAALLEQYGLDQRRLAEPGARLSIPRYMRLGHAAIQLSGDPALGLQMGRLSRLGQMGLAGVSVAQAPNLRAAARAMIHLEPLYAQNYRAGRAWWKTPAAPGCASIRSALTTPITASSSIRCWQAGSAISAPWQGSR